MFPLNTLYEKSRTANLENPRKLGEEEKLFELKFRCFNSSSLSQFVTNSSGIELNLLLETSRDSKVWRLQTTGKKEELERSKPERERLITEPLSGRLQRTPLHEHGFLSEPGRFQSEILRNLESSIIVLVWFEDNSEKHTWQHDNRMMKKRQNMNLPVSGGTCIFFIFFDPRVNIVFRQKSMKSLTRKRVPRK